MTAPLSVPAYGAAGSGGTAFTDVRAVANQDTDSPEALERVAQQFESLFLDLWLKSMRQAGSVFSDDNPFSSAAMKTHEQMLDHQWAVHLSEAGGIGIGDALVGQLAPKSAASAHSDIAPVPPRAVFPRPDAESTLTLESFGSRKALFDSPRDFVDAVLPAAKAVLGASRLNPVAVAAQAALETGWGQHVIHDAEGAPSFNLFGIKGGGERGGERGGWDGPSASVVTMEYELGRPRPQRADFRVYESLEQAFGDYRALLEGSERYRPVLEADGGIESLAAALQRSGYATDPAYASKLERVFEKLHALTGREGPDG